MDRGNYYKWLETSILASGKLHFFLDQWFANFSAR